MIASRGRTGSKLVALAQQMIMHVAGRVSRSVSSGNLGYIVRLIARVLFMSPMVSPSGAAFAIASIPVIVLAPRRFYTMAGKPAISCSFWAMTLQEMSRLDQVYSARSDVRHGRAR